MKTEIKNGLARNLRLLVFCLFLMCISERSFTQELTKLCVLTVSELKNKFSALSDDADMKLLKNELKEKGWNKFENEQMSYGVTAVRKDETGKSFPFELYVFDYYNKSTHQTGALIWRNNGKSVYKAYLLFPSGEKDFEKAMEGSVEMYADGGKIQKASSFGRCFKRCVSKSCPSFCLVGSMACMLGGVAIIAASAGTAEALALAFWLGCTGFACAWCFLNVCAYNCG